MENPTFETHQNWAQLAVCCGHRCRALPKSLCAVSVWLGLNMYCALLWLSLHPRFSALLRDKPLRSSWDRKMVAKREKELVKKFALQLKEEKAREKEVLYVCLCMYTCLCVSVCFLCACVNLCEMCMGVFICKHVRIAFHSVLFPSIFFPPLHISQWVVTNSKLFPSIPSSAPPWVRL